MNYNLDINLLFLLLEEKGKLINNEKVQVGDVTTL